MHHWRVSMSAAHADAFHKEVLANGEVWAIRDGDGFPAPESDDRRVMPFWSAQSRVQQVIDSVEAYRDFEVVSLPLAQWRSRWLPA